MYRQALLLLSLIAAIFTFVYRANSAACSQFTTQTSCENEPGCWWPQNSCTCSSNVTMDICFAFDSSGSIGKTNWPIETEWVANLIDSGLTNDARVGIIKFSTSSYYVLNFTQSQSMTQSQIVSVVDNLSYDGGQTNTVAAIKQALAMFKAESPPDISKVFVILTDGNPFLSNGGDVDVCAWADDLKAEDITTIIIGVGDQWDPAKVDCLVSSDDDIIEVTSFSTSDFDDVLPQVTAITCPVDYDLVITEVKVETDEIVYDADTPYVEVYNPSTDIPLTDLTITGLFKTNAGYSNSYTLKQGQYLVLYHSAGGNVTCQDCTCSLLPGGDWCSNALYVGCPSSNSWCTWNGGSMSNTNWYISFADASDSSTIDSVTYGSTFPAITKGYSYELKNKGYDNDAGSNWQQSCNNYGTPGADPIANCATLCNPAQCQLNGATNADCDDLTNTCICNDDNYYVDGLNCYPVPPPENCIAYWLKVNGSRYVEFIWDRADTDQDHKYILTYYTKSSGVVDITLYARTKIESDYDYDRGVNKIAGYVKTQMTVDESESAAVNCTVVTSAPTSAPTWGPPKFWIAGDICKESRCECNDDFLDWSCQGEDIYKEFAESDKEQYITLSQYPQGFPYPSIVGWKVTYMGETNITVKENSTTPSGRRLLSQHEMFAHDIVFADIGDISTTLALDASDVITPSSGYVNFTDTFSGSASIALRILSSTSRTSGRDLFVLNLVNCTSPDTGGSDDMGGCLLVYPDKLYIVVDYSLYNGGLNVTENEIPSWLYWVVGALIAFLILLGFLLYKFWWQKKASSAALKEKEAELDRAEEENELGFGHDLAAGDVTFNPMATGVPGTSRPADAMGAELNARQQNMQGEKADVAVEKFQHREQFGQVSQKKRGA